MPRRMYRSVAMSERQAMSPNHRVVRPAFVHLGMSAAFVLAMLAGAFAFAPRTDAQASLPSLGTPYTQNFDTLIFTGTATWADNATITGWYAQRTGSGTTIVASDGGSNAGNLYSYGSTSSQERALGTLGSS